MNNGRPLAAVLTRKPFAEASADLFIGVFLNKFSFLLQLADHPRRDFSRGHFPPFVGTYFLLASEVTS
jgi:hypothetical protein